MDHDIIPVIIWCLKISGSV